MGIHPDRHHPGRESLRIPSGRGFPRVGEEPLCKKSADANDDGTLDLSDASRSLGFLFLGSAPPPLPWTSCGMDPTDDGLSCQAYTSCFGGWPSTPIFIP